MNTLDYGPAYIQNLKPYIAGRPIAEVARQFGLEERTILKLASNENPLGMSLHARQVIADALEEGGALYPDPDAFELKNAIGTLLRIPRTWITLGNGSNDLIDLITRAIVAHGQSVVLSQYAFSAYLNAIGAIDARPIIAPALDFGHDLERMLQAIEPDTKLVFVANPNNPTGTFHAPEVIRDFLERIPESVVVVLDEAYTEYLPDGDKSNVAELVAQYPNLLILRTFSKAYGLAGLRIGVAVAQTHLSALLDRVRLPFNTSVIAQAAATAALGDTAFVRQTRTMNAEGLEQLYRGFSSAGLPYLRSAGNFALVNVGDGSAVFSRLLRSGIIVRPVANYGLPAWLRISVGLRSQNARLLGSLSEAVEETQASALCL